jgi:hypothetical protein
VSDRALGLLYCGHVLGLAVTLGSVPIKFRDCPKRTSFVGIRLVAMVKTTELGWRIPTLQ